jgi:hypothetical protein
MLLIRSGYSMAKITSPKLISFLSSSISSIGSRNFGPAVSVEQSWRLAVHLSLNNLPENANFFVIHEKPSPLAFAVNLASLERLRAFSLENLNLDLLLFFESQLTGSYHLSHSSVLFPWVTTKQSIIWMSHIILDWNL